MTNAVTPYVSLMIGGGTLRGSGTRYTEGALHFVINGPSTRIVDLFLTPAECRQWSTALALAAAGAESGTDGGVTRDLFGELVDRWSTRAEDAKGERAIAEEMGDSVGEAREHTTTEVIFELLEDLAKVIGR